VKPHQGTGTTRYLLDGASVLEELDGASTATINYLNNPQQIDEILSFANGGQTFYPLQDGIGSIAAIGDANGLVVRSNSYDVFGEKTTTGVGPPLAFGFTGREQDSNGLNYNRNRYYSPRQGRWLSPDRAGMIDGPNLYQYVRNLPTMLTDPTGYWINLRDSHFDQLQILYSAIASRLGFRLYLELFSVGQEVRFVHPSEFPAAAWTSGGGAGGLTGYLEGPAANSCYEYLAVSVDPVLAAGIVSIEAAMVHELRHAVDRTALRGTILPAEREPRAYAAQILAETEFGVDFDYALAKVHSLPAFKWYSLTTLRRDVFTDLLFSQASQVP